METLKDIAEHEKSFTYGITYNSLGNKLLECFPDNRYKVYDETENIICDALFDKNGIIEGRAKIYCEEGLLEFDGPFIYDVTLDISGEIFNDTIRQIGHPSDLNDMEKIFIRTKSGEC